MIRETFSEKETEELGRQAAAYAVPGDIICLDGDLGAGKTCFARGFAWGLGIEEPVTSPTFTIIKEYYGGRLPLYHFDVYRISDPDEMYAVGFEEYFYGSGVTLIEWSELIAELIPKSARRIVIMRADPEQPDRRTIYIDEGSRPSRDFH